VFPSLHESLQQVLSQRLDWKELREVQERAYRAVTAGCDALIIAPTAGGKSEAALIPVMDDILKNGRPGIACLYISPLKALINDQEERFSLFCDPTSLSVMKWHGDVPKGDRSWKEEPPHFLMITPESLEVLLQEKILSADLRRVRFIIIDELHAFVESDRGVHLKVLLARIDRLAKRKIVRIGLSATTGNPEAILHWLSDKRHGEELVTVPSAPQEKQFRFLVEPEEDRRTEALVRAVTGKKALVFVSSRSGAEDLARGCSGRLRNLHIHHSSLSPASRRQAEEAFASQDGACIICTSTLELGIDIGDLDVVVQVGPPDTVSSFLQRMGRSGRRTRAAFVFWILRDSRELLCSIAIIECAMRRQVEDLRPVTRPWNVLIQQFFLFLHSHPRTTTKELASTVLAAPLLSAIEPAVLDRIVDYLAGSGYITRDGEVIMPGPEAERVFGRSNGRDLYSVIAGGGEYRAVTPDGEFVGKLDARFVNGRDPQGLTLGGKAWSVIACDEGHNLVVVVPGGSNMTRTFWTGGNEGGLSPLVCRMVQKIVSRKGTSLPLNEKEQELLQRALAEFPAGIGAEGLYIKEDDEKKGTVTVVSMHGSDFNRVLALLLRHRLGQKVQVRYHDFAVIVNRAGKEGAVKRVAASVREIQAMDYPDIAEILPLPPRDGWKFADILPEPLFREMAVFDYYHGEDFLQILGSSTISCTPDHRQDPQVV
jgi:ATP-dependent helicase Lhr and Lhr-like helicase